MAETVVELTCPGCGARVSTGQKVCKWCHAPIVISTFNSVATMTLPQLTKYTGTYRSGLSAAPNDPDLNKSLAMCYLKLKMYRQAVGTFEKAIQVDFNDSESLFYAAIAVLNGKKAFLAGRAAVEQSEKYVNAALMIEPKGIYYYFLAYLKYDFFARKHFRTVPSYQDALNTAQAVGLAGNDIIQLYTVLGVPRPALL